MGHQCILIQWEEITDFNGFDSIQYLKNNHTKEILEIVPTYKELAIYLHLETDPKRFVKKLNEELPKLKKNPNQQKSPIYQLPVCYESSFGIDLTKMAKEKGFTIQELIELHTEPTYTIHFLGFLPGFPYLSGLNKKLHHPRLRKPRNKVPAGSVGIANDQTGVYPQASPGGWNIIGRSPVSLFNIDDSPPAVLQAGCRLQFVAIDQNRFNAIEKEMQNHNYQIQKVYD